MLTLPKSSSSRMRKNSLTLAVRELEFVSAASNLVGVLLSQAAYSAAVSIPAVMFPAFLASRGHKGFSKEPFMWVHIGFISLLIGLMLGIYLYHGWETCVAAVVIFVPMFGFLQWSGNKEYTHHQKFCRDAASQQADATRS